MNEYINLFVVESILVTSGNTAFPGALGLVGFCFDLPRNLRRTTLSTLFCKRNQKLVGQKNILHYHPEATTTKDHQK